MTKKAYYQKPPEEFSELVGRVASACGVAETMTGMVIQELGTDEILGRWIAAVRSWGYKINVLRTLLPRRGMEPEKVKDLCDDALKVVKRRNIAVHGMIGEGTVGTIITRLAYKEKERGLKDDSLDSAGLEQLERDTHHLTQQLWSLLGGENIAAPKGG